MRQQPFILLIGTTAVLAGGLAWTALRGAPELQAADAERKIATLERTVDDLQKRIDAMEDKLADREKVIAAASSGVTIKASRVTIDGGFEINLDANTIKLNGGRHAVARVGSRVDDNGKIVDGARSVLVP